jgi:hypothetical protein
MMPWTLIRRNLNRGLKKRGATPDKQKNVIISLKKALPRLEGAEKLPTGNQHKDSPSCDFLVPP